tara:strand:+ start:3673 stop:4101 length:429 start_codon:yes stop_codon:yes gene_type:complete
MSFMNPVDVTGFSSPFNVDLAVNARNKADAYTKSQAALRAGSLGGAAASFIGQAQGQKFMDKAGAYAQQQAQNAQTFGNFADLAGGLGSIGVQGGFGKNFESFFNPNSYGGTGSTGITTPGKYGSFVDPTADIQRAGFTIKP